MNNARILVSPLNWGLGHASRCIPIIRTLQEVQADVLIGADGGALQLLKKEFPELPSILLPDYKIDYPEKGNMAWHFFWQLRKMKAHLRREREKLEEIISERNIDAVISDNRYGIFNQNIPSVLITHQVNPRSPIFQRFIHRKIHGFIRNFDHCWIPDHKGPDSLSGNLSNPPDAKSMNSFIGPLSHLSAHNHVKPEYDIIAILSGPSPHRERFESILLKQLGQIQGRHILVRGRPEDEEKLIPPQNVDVRNLITGNELSELITKCKYIISRSGYSSIMDFTLMKRKAILVPTPGQYEQEYLANYHKKRGRFVVYDENKLDLKKAISELDQLETSADFSVKSESLKKTISDFVESLY